MFKSFKLYTAVRDKIFFIIESKVQVRKIIIIKFELEYISSLLILAAVLQQ